MSFSSKFNPQNAVVHAPFDMGGGGHVTANRGGNPASSVGPKATAAGGLGRYTVNVDQGCGVSTDKKNKKNKEKHIDKETKERLRKAYRRDLYDDQRAAAAIIGEHIRHDHRVCKCKWVKCSTTVDLVEKTYMGETGERIVRAGFEGLTICGNAWGCPVCADRIARKRRDEMNMAMAWARAQGFVPVLVTLTARHGFDDRLEDLLSAMKNSKRRLRQRREWKSLPVEGSICATEMTHGRNGWHPHFHELVFLRAKNEREALRMMKPLAHAWRVSLAAFGLDGNAAAFDVRGAANAGTYITKFGVAEEMSMREGKKAKGGGRIPRELARAAAEGGKGSKQAEMLWLEYFRATSGKRRKLLTWSHGLKRRVGVDEVTDEEAAQDVDGDEENKPTPLREYDNETWRKVRPRRVQILEAAESGQPGAIERAEIEPEPEPEDDVDLVDDDDFFAEPPQNLVPVSISPPVSPPVPPPQIGGHVTEIVEKRRLEEARIAALDFALSELEELDEWR